MVSFASQAEDVVFGGAQANPGESYSYAGIQRPMAGATLGQGWFVVAISDYLQYSYNTVYANKPVTVSVSAPGLSSGVGYAFKHDDQLLELALNVGAQDYQISPDIPVNNPVGLQYKLSPNFYWRRQFDVQWYGSVRAVYDFGPRSYWSQTRIAFQPDWRWQIGPTFIAAGGQNYQNRQLGMFANINLGDGVTIEPELGATIDPSQPVRAYEGISFSYLF
jgi:hypothetical protein